MAILTGVDLSNKTPPPYICFLEFEKSDSNWHYKALRHQGTKALRHNIIIMNSMLKIK
jgi:hypothetical protein